MNPLTNLKKFYRYYYLSSFFYDFIFAYIIFAAFFKIKGLSVFEISLIFAWWSIMGVVFEIPTGVLADYWSRKKIFVLAPLIKTACFIIWFFADGDFFLYALGVSFWSLSDALISGCSEALLYDTLIFFQKKKDYSKAIGKRNFFFYLSLSISCLLGGVIASYHLDGIMLVSLIPLLLSSIFALKIPDVVKNKKKTNKNHFMFLSIAIKEIRSKPVLFYLGIYLFAISLFEYLAEYDSLYLQLVGIRFSAFGIYGAVSSILSACGAYYAYKLKKYHFLFYLLPFLSGLLLLISSVSVSITSLIFLVLAYFLCSPLFVLIEEKMQNNISSHTRATTNSAVLFLLNIFGIFLFLLMGLSSKIWNLQSIYLISGIFLIIFALWSFYFRKKI